MKKNIFLNGFMSPVGKALAKKFKGNGYYVYGTDVNEDYEGVCDRSLRFDINQFVKEAAYRIRFSQIFEELMPRVDVLINIGTDIKIASLDKLDLGNWQDAININMTGPLLLCKILLQRLESTKGTIINISNNGDNHLGVGKSILNTAAGGLAKGAVNELQAKVGVFTISVNNKNEMNEEAGLGQIAELAYFLTSDESKGLNGTNFEVKLS